MNTAAPHPVLIVGFDARYTRLVAHHMRGASMCSEIVAHAMSIVDVPAKEPATIIPSDGPSSVYEDGISSIDPAIFDMGVPILGTCRGFQTMAQALGGTARHTGTRGHDHADASIVVDSRLFASAPGDQVMRISHDGAVQTTPSGFEVTTSTAQTPVATFENHGRRFFDLRWRSEVVRSAFGQDALKNLLYGGAGIEPSWTPGSVANEQVEKIRGQIGDAQVICMLSRGVDSSVIATPVHKAVDDQLTCSFIDHGLLRVGRREQVENNYTYGMGIRIIAYGESKRSLSALTGVSGPETKRKVIGREFTRSFETAQKQAAEEAGTKGEMKFLVRGTLYPDIIESGDDGGVANIKSRHNVDGLPDGMTFELVEPLRTLFKDGVRAVEREPGLPDYPVNHRPFPGPGLGIHITDKVTKERPDILHAADLIACEELSAAGLDSQIW